MKITEALSNVITEAGGTPTAEDGKSVTHALGTLYTTLGGTDELPNDVAERINSLSDHIGGGGGEPTPYRQGSFILKNETTGTVSWNGVAVKEIDGEYVIYQQAKAITANSEKEIPCLLTGQTSPSYGGVMYSKMTIQKSVDITNLSATVSGVTSYTAQLLRTPDEDKSGTYAFVLGVLAVNNSGTEIPVITITA